jgi:hypothetical protein
MCLRGIELTRDLVDGLGRVYKHHTTSKREHNHTNPEHAALHLGNLGLQAHHVGVVSVEVGTRLNQLLHVSKARLVLFVCGLSSRKVSAYARETCLEVVLLTALGLQIGLASSELCLRAN